MARPFAVIGFTFLTMLWFLGKAGEMTAVICAAIFLVLSIVALSVRSFRRTVVWPCTFIAALAACISFGTAYHTQYKPVLQLDQSQVQMVAHMEDLPYLRYGRTVYPMESDSINGESYRISFDLISSRELDMDCSDYVALKGKFYSQSNTGGVRPIGRMYDNDSLSLTPGPESFRSMMLRIRRYIEEKIVNTVHGDYGAVLKALLTGNKDSISSANYNNIVHAGIAHLMAVSGFHLSVFTMLLVHFLEKRNANRILSTIAPALLVVFLIFATGCSKSAIRAGLMLLIAFLCKLIGRIPDGLNSLGLSVLLMGIGDPFCATDIGLILSVLGSLSVILFSSYTDRLARKIPLKILRPVLSTILISFLINIVNLPVSVLRFGTFSLVAPLTNALTMIPAELAMILSAVGIVLSLWNPLEPLFRLVMLPAGLLAKYCLFIARILGGHHFSSLPIEYKGASFWIVGILALVAVAIVLPVPRQRKIIFTATVAVCTLLCSYCFYFFANYNQVQIVISDCGDATSVLVHSDHESAVIGSSNLQIVSTYSDPVKLLLVPRTSVSECGGYYSEVSLCSPKKIVVPMRNAHTLPYFLSDNLTVSRHFQDKIGKVNLKYYYENEDVSAVLLKANGKNILLLFSPSCDISKLPSDFQQYHFLYTRSDLPQALRQSGDTVTFVSCEPERDVLFADYPNIYTTSGQGDLILTISREGLIHIERGA